jgi:DNA-binding transcriptional LysR family regulator
MLDLRRLRLLHALSIHGTLAATARACHVTGPAVSQQLSILEREVGVPVVERVGRGLRLTDAGRVLVSHTRIVLDQLAAAEADLVALGTTTRGTVRIAAFSSAVATVVASTRRTVRAAHDSAMQLQIATLEPDDAIAALQRGEADLAITYSYQLAPRHLPPWTEQHELLTDPVLLALPANDPLNSRSGEVDIAALAERDWILPQPSTTCRQMIERVCGNAAFVPRAVAYGTDFPAILALLAAGDAVALVPRAATYQLPPAVTLRAVKPSTSREIYAVTRHGGDRHPAVRIALDHLRDSATRLNTTWSEPAE